MELQQGGNINTLRNLYNNGEKSDWRTIRMIRLSFGLEIYSENISQRVKRSLPCRKIFGKIQVWNLCAVIFKII